MATITHVLCVLIALVVTSAGRARMRDDDVTVVTKGDECVQRMERVYRGRVESPSPPRPTGTWASQGCEVRPGGQFLLRKYHFLPDSAFEAIQFYYSDSNCHTPSHAVVAQGHFKVDQKSWVVPGAHEVDYSLSSVTVIPYTAPAALALSNQVNNTCLGFVKSPWKPYHRYEIYHFLEVAAGYRANTMTKITTVNRHLTEDHEDGSFVLVDRDCLAALTFTLHELQLMRIEKHPGHRHQRTLLYLGDIHTEESERHLYRPTGYQEALATPQSCNLCRVIAEATVVDPPSLHRKSVPERHLSGSWFSTRCETRAAGTFLTRHMSFGVDGRTWQGYYHNFADELCTESLSTIFATGTYEEGAESELVGGAYHYDFKITEAKVTARDMRMVHSLNNEGCKTSQPWIIDEEQIIPNSGCPVLGIEVPHVEYELLKLEHHHSHLYIYMGQRPTDGSLLGDPSKRPTSFQPALVRCSDDVMPVTPPGEFHVSRQTNAASSAVSVCCVLLLACGFLHRLLT